MQGPTSIERFFRGGLKLAQLRVLVALADLGQVTRVAAAFHVTQPAISKQLAEIEGALGVAVAQRVGNRLELTAVGQVIVDCGREVLRRIELAQRDVGALAAGLGGRVSVGAVVTVPQAMLTDAVRVFNRRAPAAALCFVEATLDRLLRMLEDGDLDVAVGRNRVAGAYAQGAHLAQQVLGREAFVFVVGAGHPLAVPGHATSWADLAGFRWITPLHGSPAYATLAEAWEEHGLVPPQGNVESSSLALNLSLLQSGDYVSILPDSLARRHVLRGRMRVLPLPALEPLGEIVAYWRNDAAAPATDLFVACLEEAAGTLLAGLAQGHSNSL
jgi:DNA-binding transcriptional LysR family regulator